MLTAEVDAPTNNRFLWLRSTAPSMSISSAVPWDQVSGATYEGRSLDVNELRTLADRLKSELVPEDPDSSLPPPRPTRLRLAAPSPPHRPHRVQSLEIDARIANWDADAEMDGLEIRISPLGPHGTVVPVSGSLRVRLTGQRVRGRRLREGFSETLGGIHDRHRIGHHVRGTRSREQFPEIGRWSHPVHPLQFDPYGAVFRLPFRTVQPGLDLEFDPYGQLHAQFTAPMHGSFAASIPVRIRAFSPVRDRLQLYYDRRFLSDER